MGAVAKQKTKEGNWMSTGMQCALWQKNIFKNIKNYAAPSYWEKFHFSKKIPPFHGIAPKNV